MINKLDPSENRFLIITKECIRTSITDPVIAKLDKYFARYNHKAFVTSILRTPSKQLEIIREYVILKGLDKEYPEILSCKVEDKTSDDLYVWQKAWSKLLNIGVIINPPIAARCLYDYWRGGVNKKGELIPPSPHFFGNCFDIGGGGGKNSSISDELSIITTAMNEDKKIGIRNIVLERENNCLHINCVVK
ncbi:MAG: hypothetical protein QXP66_01835 [Candidatus Aenigmatarchaeota archaeon]